jgi:hypothetical protein
MLAISKKLLELTEAGKIDWRATDNNNAFLYTGSTASVLLGRLPAEWTVTLSLWNSTGPVESIREGPNTESVLSNLYELARQRALQPDRIIADFLRELDDIPPS